MQVTVGKLANGKIVEVLGITPDKGISIFYEVYSDRAFELRQYIPISTRFVWVRNFSFKDIT